MKRGKGRRAMIEGLIAQGLCSKEFSFLFVDNERHGSNCSEGTNLIQLLLSKGSTSSL